MPVERIATMDFAFNSDQQLLHSTLSEFARRELALSYAARDADVDLPRYLVVQLGQMGLLAPTVGQAFGGQELDHVALGIAHEEIARGDFNAAYVMMLAALTGVILAEHGDDRQRADFLPDICSGRALPAHAVTEPGRGSDAAHVTFSARRDGDAYVLNGE